LKVVCISPNYPETFHMDALNNIWKHVTPTLFVIFTIVDIFGSHYGSPSKDFAPNI
jgi:hypothetical protein